MSVREYESVNAGLPQSDAGAAARAVEANGKRGAETVANVMDRFGERGSW